MLGSDKLYYSPPPLSIFNYQIIPCDAANSWPNFWARAANRIGFRRKKSCRTHTVLLIKANIAVQTIFLSPKGTKKSVNKSVFSADV
jgi:hypothetical protein